MKLLLVVVVMIFSVSSVWAAKDCSSVEGVCKYSCAGSESKVQGYFPDCDYRQVCCTSGEKSAERKEVSGETGKKASDSKRTATVQGETSAKKSVEGKSAENAAQSVYRVLVCSPSAEAYAYADTVLQCGGMTTTLNNLYRENYRLIQILSSAKVLYYFEKQDLR